MELSASSSTAKFSNTPHHSSSRHISRTSPGKTPPKLNATPNTPQTPSPNTDTASLALPPASCTRSQGKAAAATTSTSTPPGTPVDTPGDAPPTSPSKPGGLINHKPAAFKSWADAKECLAANNAAPERPASQTSGKRRATSSPPAARPARKIKQSPESKSAESTDSNIPSPRTFLLPAITSPPAPAPVSFDQTAQTHAAVLVVLLLQRAIQQQIAVFQTELRTLVGRFNGMMERLEVTGLSVKKVANGGKKK